MKKSRKESTPAPDFMVFRVDRKAVENNLSHFYWISIPFEVLKVDSIDNGIVTYTPVVPDYIDQQFVIQERWNYAIKRKALIPLTLLERELYEI